MQLSVKNISLASGYYSVVGELPVQQRIKY